MTVTFAFVVLLVALALIFDYINGFHDAANSIATVVSTRVLSPGMAVIWAAFFNFVAFAVFGTRVAKAIGDGVRMDLITPELRLYVLLCALLGAILWNLITWYLGLPTSSSHALLGGYAGAGIAAYGGVIGLLNTVVRIDPIEEGIGRTDTIVQYAGGQSRDSPKPTGRFQPGSSACQPGTKDS